MGAKPGQNPVMALPGVEELLALPPESRAALATVLRSLRHDANVKAEESWRRRKGPMAAYWRAVSTYAGHLARACRDGA